MGINVGPHYFCAPYKVVHGARWKENSKRANAINVSLRTGKTMNPARPDKFVFE